MSTHAGNATFVPADGYWHSAANSTQLHSCPRSSACTYSAGRSRTQALLTCQENWYSLYTNSSIPSDELARAQAALPCQLWNINSAYPQCVSHFCPVLRHTFTA